MQMGHFGQQSVVGQEGIEQMEENQELIHKALGHLVVGRQHPCVYAHSKTWLKENRK